MEYIRDLENYDLNGASAVTFGKFDGVHLGHRLLIDHIREKAKEHHGKALVFTFDISPQVKMGQRKRKMLMTNLEREEMMHDLGMDILVECPFTEAIRNMDAESFVRDICIGKLHMKAAAVGTDFRFARDRQGTPQILKELGKKYGFTVEIVPKVSKLGAIISSSRIRTLLEEGRMEEVAELLGYPYYISGEIVHGRHLGHSLGFPTINQIPEEEKLLPPRGVYISRTLVAGKVYQGVSNIGVKPTVHGNGVGIETYLFDCNLDLYGQEARVELLTWTRPEKKFDSLDELKAQMDRDIQKADLYFEKKMRESV